MRKQVTNITNVYLSLPGKQIKPKQTIILEEPELNEYMLDRINSYIKTNCLKVFDIKENIEIVELQEEVLTTQNIEPVEESTSEIVEEKPKRKRTKKQEEDV